MLTHSDLFLFRSLLVFLPVFDFDRLLDRLLETDFDFCLDLSFFRLDLLLDFDGDFDRDFRTFFAGDGDDLLRDFFDFS